MKVDVLLGLQWGDEGKGKIVDVLTPRYDIIARFQGGPNAGHTLEFDGRKHVLHTIPSGIFREGKLNLIGNGVVIDPVTLKREIEEVEEHNVDVDSRLLISRKAHLILPTHRLLDAANEQDKGKDKIGSTLRGIGPTYMDKTGRNGLRVGDIFLPDFQERYNKLVQKHKRLLGNFTAFDFDLSEHEPAWFEAIDRLRQIQVVDSEQWINDQLDAGQRVLAEGAQGTLLDIDFGTYPFVTSSTTTAAGACTGLGVAPTRIGEVIGIFKAYCTRVGSGPFPTELHGETGEALRVAGHEFGATTGRPRRCGWLDLPALKHACMLNGATQLCMMKADVLDAFDEVQVCTHYEVDGKTSEHLPYLLEEALVKPVFESRQGWPGAGQSGAGTELPVSLHAYVQEIEVLTKTRVSIVSMGPDRAQTHEMAKTVGA
ncbi:adenylosuccinate synthase [Flavobacteriales bacterium]|nr:adenylosuccinate synthase [Flavobacteriales bacterium]